MREACVTLGSVLQEYIFHFLQHEEEDLKKQKPQQNEKGRTTTTTATPKTKYFEKNPAQLALKLFETILSNPAPYVDVMNPTLMFKLVETVSGIRMHSWLERKETVDAQTAEYLHLFLRGIPAKDRCPITLIRWHMIAASTSAPWSIATNPIFVSVVEPKPVPVVKPIPVDVLDERYLRMLQYSELGKQKTLLQPGPRTRRAKSFSGPSTLISSMATTNNNNNQHVSSALFVPWTP